MVRGSNSLGGPLQGPPKLGFMAFSYYQLYQMKTDRYFLRQQIIVYAKEYGLKPAARHFACSRNTVRLKDLSKKPHRCPHQTPKTKQAVVLRLRKQTGFGAQRLKMVFLTIGPR